MMTSLKTPGVYIEPVTRKQPTAALVRSDITAFLGYARKGPVAVPVQLHSWRQFSTIFGETFDAGYLATAVKGFFENGGVTCYIIRITDQSSQPARFRFFPSANCQWTFTASYLLSTLSDRSAEGRAQDTVARIAIEQQAAATSRRMDNPGQWGNALTLSIDRELPAGTATVPGIQDQGFVTEVKSITGLGANTAVELFQDANENGSGEVRHAVSIERVDRLHQIVYWPTSLKDLGFDLLRPILLQRVEFSIRIALNNRVVERFDHLTIHPKHERYIVSIVNRQSRYLELSLTLPGHHTSQKNIPPECWPPAIFNQPFSGGMDGLTGIKAEHYLRILRKLEKKGKEETDDSPLERVEDIGLIAAPDLVLRTLQYDSAAPMTSIAASACHNRLEAKPKGVLKGTTKAYPEGVDTDADLSAQSHPVPGVTVTCIADDRQVRTSSDDRGRFLFENIIPGPVTLRFEKPGFAFKESQTIVQPGGTGDAIDVYLSSLLLPRALSDTEIISVQHAMADHAAQMNRFALLDPPEAEMTFEKVRGWRQKIGDKAHVALYYPWLGVPETTLTLGSTEIRWLPPCGHVAGIVAKTDLSEGVYRSPANIALRHVKRLSMQMDDSRHGVLNTEGINVIRQSAGRGLAPYGARTLSSDGQWRYLNVRRLVSTLKKTLEKRLQWAVFENNTVLLRQAVASHITALLNRLWRSGALVGDRPEAAYAVKCDRDNNPNAVRDAGRLIAEVAVAPAVPYEFIIFKLDKTLEAIEVTE
jgi:hypothetical protein